MERLRARTFWGPDEYNLWLTYQEVDPSHVTNLRIFGRNHRDISNINRFTNLQSLYISNTSITTIPEVVYTFRGLRELQIISNENISSISENIGNLTNLIMLKLFGIRITSLPESIGRLTNLQQLNIGNSIITTFPENILTLPYLRELEVYNTEITSIPEGIGNLGSLIMLKLNDNNITEIPNSIGNLVNLVSLNLSYNEISEVPESIGNLRSLRELYLDNNNISELPESIGRLVNLLSLRIYGNNIRQLPMSFSRIRTLVEFLRDPHTEIPEGFRMRVYNNTNNINTNNTNTNNTNTNTNTNNEEPIRNYNNLARVGRAFQIHEAFDRIDKTALKQYFIEHDAAHRIFDTNDAFISYLNDTFRGVIDTLEDRESATRNFETIYSRILSRVNYSPEQQELFSLALEFTKGQPQEFIQNYVSNYINDTLHAYNGGGNTISCAKGAIERIITSLVPAAMLYADQNAFRESGYNRLVSIITLVPMADIRSIFNAHSQECYEAHPEDVAAFRECIKSKARGLLGNRYNNAAANEELGPLVNSLGLYGGRRQVTRRTRKGRRVARKAERKVQRKTRKGRRRQNKGAK